LELKFRFSGRDGKCAAGSQLVASKRGFAVDPAGSHIVNAIKARDVIPSLPSVTRQVERHVARGIERDYCSALGKSDAGRWNDKGLGVLQ
jgi:hypothetical protein